jgi:broad specificity phosphatase PhoE
VTDLELNEIGSRQAEEMADQLSCEEIHAVYSSNLKRAIQTASVVSQRHNLAVIVDDSLRELDHGELEGLTFSEVRATRPEFFRGWRAKPADLLLPGGERLIDVEKRVWEGMVRIVRRHGPQETLVIVSHQFPILSILCRITGTPLNQYRSFHLDPCAIVCLSYGREDDWRLLQVNGKRAFRGS